MKHVTLPLRNRYGSKLTMNKVFNKPDYFYLAIALTFTTLVIGAVVATIDIFKVEKKIPRFDEGLIMENEKLQELSFDQVEVIDSEGSEVKNVISDANDKRAKSFDDWSQDVTNSVSGNSEQRFKEFEEQLQREAQESAEKRKILEKGNDNLSSRLPTPETNKNSTGISENQFKGDVMVSFSLTGRTAFNGNNWYVRNPGYTCGRGSGLVIVNILVGKDGRVVKATVDNAKSTGNPCMKEQAQKYAQMSRFNISTKTEDSQMGYIQYKFVSQ
ncbi:MAG: hypothetical protein FJX80_09020 [Bacteroidetes bacterium]|nr:hypothetical protein [Bacteroidota bacterium]